MSEGSYYLYGSPPGTPVASAAVPRPPTPPPPEPLPERTVDYCAGATWRVLEKRQIPPRFSATLTEIFWLVGEESNTAIASWWTAAGHQPLQMNQQTTDFQTSARLCPVLISLLWHLSTWFAVFPYHPSFATFRESAAFNTAWSRLRTEAFCFLGKLVEHVKQLRQIAGSASASSSNDHHGDIRGLLAAYKVVHETLLTLHPGNLHSNYTAVVNMVDGQVHRACQKVVQQVGGDMHPAATAEQLRFSNTRQSGAPDKVGKPYYSLHGWAGPRYIQPPMQQGKPWDNQFLHRMDPSRHDPATTGMIPDQHAWKIMHTSQVGSQSVASGAVVPERGVGNVRAARADIETPAEYSSLRLHGGFGHAAGASQICFVSTFDQLAQASGYDDADDSRLTDDARAHIQNEADEWDRRERAMELAGMGHR